MTDDLDISLDQSSRITRRIAYGSYRLAHDNQPIGEEVWGIFGLLNGGYRLMTDIDQEWPTPNQQWARLDVDAQWNPQRLWVQVDVEGYRRTATYLPSEDVMDIEIVEARLQRDEEKAGSKHSSKARPNGRRLQTQFRADKGKVVARKQLACAPATHLDFGSALFNFVVLQRVRLMPGTPMAFGSIVLTLPSLEPLELQQEYRYERDEPVRGDPGRPLARRYLITEQDEYRVETAFWTDERGIVLAQQLDVNGAPHSCDLLQYTWTD